jgi:regulator of protease activity HflC (stomatin/prohibitin superfamily)
MARSSILDRFRPVGAPGPAGPVGVPSTDVPGYVTELVPVFAALDADIDRARGDVQEAQARATDAVARARADATAEIARARREAGAERAAAAAAVAEAAAQDDARLIVDAQEAADAISRSSAARLPGIVGTVVDRILLDHLGEAR